MNPLQYKDPSVDIRRDPEDYICPIGQIFMRHPVRTSCKVNNGSYHIFEEICLIDWLEKNSTCPIDRDPINKNNLLLDKDLQKEIIEYLKEHPEEDDSDDYNAILNKYLKKQTFLSRLFQQSWKKKLRIVHQAATICFLFTTIIYINSLALSDNQTEKNFNHKNFYCMCLTGSISILTSSFILNSIPISTREFHLIDASYRV